MDCENVDGGEWHAFLYDASAATPKMEDLNTLIPADSGWPIGDARAINSDGMIAATGHKDGVGTHALLLTPPSSDTPPPADSEAPTVMDSSLMPASGATNVARNTIVAASFSEAIDPKTLVTTPKDSANPNVGTSTTFTLVKDGTSTSIDATVSYKDSTNTVTLDPSSNLAHNTKYTAKITGGTNGVKDLAGNPLASDFSWSFTTGSR
jgi:hypothetical protein